MAISRQAERLLQDRTDNRRLRLAVRTDMGAPRPLLTKERTQRLVDDHEAERRLARRSRCSHARDQFAANSHRDLPSVSCESRDVSMMHVAVCGVVYRNP